MSQYVPLQDDTGAGASGQLPIIDPDQSSANAEELEDRDVEESEADVPYAGFFQVGRDFEPSNVTHKFTQAEKRKMAQFETVEYHQPNNRVYAEHVEAEPVETLTQKWVAFAVVGASVGLTAFTLKQTIEAIGDSRLSKVQDLLRDGDSAGAYFVQLFHSLGFALAAALLVVFGAPLAAGSGVPEVMGYLNGVHVPSIFNIRTMIFKYFSCICAVGSGLPVGPEGPMISLGAGVGAGMSQGRSRTLRYSSSFFERFRNSKDKRDFITAGAAAGVSAAFGAPVGGLLFAMEEVSSYWEQRLTWMVFFGCMVSTFTINLFASSFDKWEWKGGEFGYFDDNATILFHVDQVVRFNVAALPVIVFIGLVGGILGTTFTFFNLKITRWRSAVIKPSHVRRILEPCVVIAMFATLMFVMPYMFSCKTAPEATSPRTELLRFTCKAEEGVDSKEPYNAMATLSLSSGDAAIRHLFARGEEDSHLFGYGEMFLFFFVYFTFACYCAGMAISSGLVVPMLLIGACSGRIIGLGVVDALGHHEWADPGMFALLGASAFFAGVSRLTVSLTVIMLEISNDIHLLLPIMLCVMIAKWTADFATHSLYHALLEIKCVPFLDVDSVVPKLQCFQVAALLNTPIVNIQEKVQVAEVLRMLSQCTHNAFPVVVPSHETHSAAVALAELKLPASSESVIKSASNAEEEKSSTSRSTSGATPATYVFKGLILRSQLEMLLSHPNHFAHSRPGGASHSHAPVLSYAEAQQYAADAHTGPTRRRRQAQQELRRSSLLGLPVAKMADEFGLRDSHFNMWLDLRPYVNTSALSISAAFSADMAYTLFRSMALRHLTVVSDRNEPMGMITRKDLVGQTIEERIESAQHLRRHI